jgi:nitrite reductase/ring-hydroxylating ferredoxin subunit
MNDIRIEANLDNGNIMAVEDQGLHVLVSKISDEYYAISNICSHAKILLSKGKLRGTVITCPLHGARFDVRTGKCLGGPAVRDVSSYDVTEDDNDIIIRIS